MNRKGIGNVTQTLQTNLRDSIRFPFQEFFREENIDVLLQELGFAYRARVFNPLITLLTFIAQILVDKCCRSADAVLGAGALRASGRPASSRSRASHPLRVAHMERGVARSWRELSAHGDAAPVTVQSGKAMHVKPGLCIFLLQDRFYTRLLGRRILPEQTSARS